MRTAFCFDLDGTVTSEEILPRLSRETDISEEITTLTEATIKGVIPFERSFRLRIRLLREIPVSRAGQIIVGVALQPEVTEFIRGNSENCYVVTGNLDVFVENLADRIGCTWFSSKAEVDGDRLLGIREILDKGTVVSELKERYSRVVSVGDGMNDVSMFERSDIKIAYGGVHPPVESLITLADFVTYDGKGLCNILNTLNTQ